MKIDISCVLMSIRCYPLCLLALLSTLSASAQIADTLHAHRLTTRADSLYDLSQYKSAIADYQAAAQIYRQYEFWEEYVDCLNGMAANWLYLSNYGKTKEYAEQAITVSTEKVSERSLGHAEAYNILGRMKEEQGKYDTAELHYQRALKIAQEQENEVKINRSLNHLGSLYSVLGTYKESLALHRRALNILKDSQNIPVLRLAATYVYLGNAFGYLETYDSALVYYRWAEKIYKERLTEEGLSVSSCYNNIGAVYHDMGFYEKALKYFLKSLTVDERVHGRNSPYLGATLMNVGSVYTDMGFYSKALNYFNRALSIENKFHSNDHMNIGQIYHNIGYLYKDMNKHRTALYYYKKTLDNYEQTLPVTHEYFGDLYTLIGEAYHAIGDYNEALSYHDKSVEAYRLLEEFRLFYTYKNLGATYGGLGKNKTALSYFQRALNIGRKQWHGKHPYLADCYNKIGHLYREQGHYDFALRYFEFAWYANVVDTLAHDWQAYLTPFPLLTSLVGTATALEQKFQAQKQTKDLEAALVTYHWADTLVRHVRQTLQYNSDRVELGKKAPPVYEGGIRVSLALAERATDPTERQRYRAEAFAWAERSKAGVLSLALTNHQARRFAGIPDRLLAQERDLRQQQAYCRSQLSGELAADTGRTVRFQRQLFELNRAHEQLIDRLEQDYPRYHALKYRSNYQSLSETQASLDDETALLEYFVGDSAVYVFTVTADGNQVTWFRRDTTFGQLTTELRQCLNRERSEPPAAAQQRFYRTSHALYQQALAPALQDLPAMVRRLVVVPDGALSHLPFDLLLTQPVVAATDHPRRLPYLLRDYRVSYTYAASLRPTSSASSGTATPRLVAFAPTYAQRPLRGNQTEAQRVGERWSGTVYPGAEATKARFRAEAGQYDILHLAMHTQPEAEDSTQFYLAFAPGDSVAHDGRLSAHELYALELPAPLVVLSTCRAGDGTWARGEGLMSLARAFTFAGARSLVFNRWAADDATTAPLMSHFYEYLAQGLPKDEALQRAKLDYLDQAPPAYLHPFYWGGFVVLGDPAPVVPPVQTASLRWSARVAGLLLLAGLVMLSARGYRRPGRLV